MSSHVEASAELGQAGPLVVPIAGFLLVIIGLIRYSAAARS
jgi:hypothetical protein